MCCNSSTPRCDERFRQQPPRPGRTGGAWQGLLQVKCHTLDSKVPAAPGQYTFSCGQQPSASLAHPTPFALKPDTDVKASMLGKCRRQGAKQHLLRTRRSGHENLAGAFHSRTPKGLARWRSTKVQDPRRTCTNGAGSSLHLMPFLEHQMGTSRWHAHQRRSALIPRTVTKNLLMPRALPESPPMR